MRLVMDPLGKAADVVEAGALQPWAQVAPAHRPTDYSSLAEDRRHVASPFPCNHRLNKKVVLWVGNIASLNVDAVVNTTNESLNERNPISDGIFARAGPGLLKEIQEEVRECRTGEVRVTQGHNLPARYVIHTVGPKYNIKYQTAAQNTLHSCYRNVLQKACELGVSSIALCVVNSVRRNFPPDEGAHIALRTVRRFLEKHGSSLETVVFAIGNADIGIYEVLLPLYFPRSPQEEQNALWQLPANVGGPDGEPIQPDRQIRIIDNPQHALEDDSGDLSSHFETSLSVGELAFSQMQGDLDQQRLLGERPPTDPLGDLLVKEMHTKERYERLLRRAKTEDLSEVSGIGCLYQSGVDRLGRPVIVFVGKWFRFSEINLDKALLYLIYLLDPLVKGDYAIAYFHTLTSSANHPSFAWLREVYNILPYKYKKNLKAFYIVHPTIWTKMMTWWFTTFMAPAIKQKVHSLPGVEYLYSTMSPEQLEIPAFITEYDMTINGLRYFQPESPT
ncbi:protein GDAP2 homolog [Bacillus rossius redtenbacheri]|uniref:protein GDAP2 homolog n=1 Tax=Bacillus rossius redtenbacheri TaxID=93214 RepID=UPI002FDD7C7C